MTVTTMDPLETMIGTANGVGLWAGPVGTAAPTNLTTAFATPWYPLGYASDDGVTVGGDLTVESFVPWQTTIPIRTVITEKTFTVSFTLWQINGPNMALWFDVPAPTVTTGAFNFDVPSSGTQQLRSLAVDVKDGTAQYRFVLPRATLESRGDMAINRGAMVPLEVTLSALDYNGIMARVWASKHPAGELMAEIPYGDGNGGEQQPEQQPEAQPLPAEQPVPEQQQPGEPGVEPEPER